METRHLAVRLPKFLYLMGLLQLLDVKTTFRTYTSNKHPKKQTNKENFHLGSAGLDFRFWALFGRKIHENPIPPGPGWAWIPSSPSPKCTWNVMAPTEFPPGSFRPVDFGDSTGVGSTKVVEVGVRWLMVSTRDDLGLKPIAPTEK